MLDPDRRLLLFDALRPPAGTVFDRAVGTTFSLDLNALLTAPVAFALFDSQLAESGDRSRINVLTLMEGVRRHATNIDLFYQAGQIALPDRYQPLTAFLERTVHPAVASDRAGIFHPKVWAIRYRSPSGVPSYRLLVLSRNLTFDASWDVMVQLDGTAGSDPDDRNTPLVDFVTGLPDLSTRDFDSDRRQAIETLATELSTVGWEKPEHITSFEFLLGGMAGHSLRLPERGTRVLVISPFVSAEQLAVMARLADDVTLVSRTESLDALPADALDGIAEVRVLDSDATLAGETEDTASPFEETAERAGCELSGLHAKVLVVDRGPGADFVTGSMNATSAGWGRNVEFGLLMRGGTASCGVDAVLGRDGSQPNLDSLLSRYRRPESGPVEASDEDRAALRLERIGRGLAALAFTAWVDFDDDTNRALTLISNEPIDAPTDVAITCRPVTQSSDNAVAVTAGAPVEARFPVLSLQSLTSFFVFELATTAPSGMTTRVVVNADLRNEPYDRLQRVLTDQLRNKGDVLRYLLLLLADGGDDGLAHLIGAITGIGWDADADERHTVDVPLLESMLRALARSPETLDPIHRLITDLQATDEGRSLLPDHLDELWPAVWEARETLR